VVVSLAKIEVEYMATTHGIVANRLHGSVTIFGCHNLGFCIL
jgi:hypothetical protein